MLLQTKRASALIDHGSTRSRDEGVGRLGESPIYMGWEAQGCLRWGQFGAGTAEMTRRFVERAIYLVRRQSRLLLCCYVLRPHTCFWPLSDIVVSCFHSWSVRDCCSCAGIPEKLLEGGSRDPARVRPGIHSSLGTGRWCQIKQVGELSRT